MSHRLTTNGSTHQTPTPNNRPLFPEPTLRLLALPLQYNRITLQPRRHIIPRARDQLIFSPQVLDLLLEFELHWPGSSVHIRAFSLGGGRGFEQVDSPSLSRHSPSSLSQAARGARRSS